MRKYSTTLIIALLISAIISVKAQVSDSAMNSALTHTLDSMLQRLGVNGISAAIQFNDESMWTGVNGVSSFTPLDSITPEHIFETGSTTKTITAMCIMQLHDEGKISLDDSLHQWLQPYPHIDSTITIRQLLRHESGIADLLLNPVFQPTLLQNPARIWTADEALQTFMLPPVFSPGASWAYSNTNYVLMGMIIEKATGQSFDQEIRDRFFTPLGLTSFINPAVDTIVEPYAHLWLDTNGDGVLDDAGQFITSWYSLFSIIGPPGGYFTTAKDLAKWIRASMQGSLLESATWQAALETVPTNLPNGIRYGYGIMASQYDGLQAHGHGGDLSYSTQAQYFPEFDMSIIVTCNDARITSWNLITTVQALLKTYRRQTAMSAIEIAEIPKQISITVSPNPFIQQTTIGIDSPKNFSDLDISVFDVAGNKVYQQQRPMATNNTSVQISLGDELVAGTYYVVVKQHAEVILHDILIKTK